MVDVPQVIDQAGSVFGRFFQNPDNYTVLGTLIVLVAAGWGLKKGYNVVRATPSFFRSLVSGVPGIVVQRVVGMVPFVGGPALLGDAVYNWKTGISSIPAVNPGMATGLGAALTLLSLMLLFGDITEPSNSKNE